MGLLEQRVEHLKESTHPFVPHVRQDKQIWQRNGHHKQPDVTKDLDKARMNREKTVELDKAQQQADMLLLQRIRQQDAAALQRFYDQHAQKTYNLIVRIVGDTAVAEEILQETFWQVWKKADGYRGSGSVAAWLYRIARNKSLDSLRRVKARPQIAAQDPQEVKTHHTPHTAVEAHVAHQLNKHHLQQALDMIPQEQRHCLELAFFNNMSQRQIAAHTNTSLGTVKTRIRLGLEKLERFLRASGYKEEDVL